MVEEGEGAVSAGNQRVKRRLNVEYVRALIDKHWGSVIAIAREAGVSREAVYRFLRRHPRLEEYRQQKLRELDEEIPACARANIARAILREAGSEKFPLASFRYLYQREGVSLRLGGQVIVLWDLDDSADDPSQLHLDTSAPSA